MQAVTISQISPPELETLIESVLHRVLNTSPVLLKQPSNKQYVYGLQGLSAFLKCSHPTAQRIKNTLPKDSFTQVGRKIVFDINAVITALNKKG